MNAETIFLVAINYIVIIFKSQEKNLGCLAENQSLKEVFADKVQSIAVKLYTCFRV